MMLCSSLMPSDNRNAWRLPILLFAIFILVIILVIIFVVLGYATVDYDEVNDLFGFCFDDDFHLILVWCYT